MAKILVIDDDPAILTTVDLVLKRAGHQVVTSINAFEGLERLAQEAFDLVIVDLYMPEMDGIETMTQIGLRHPKLQVIVLSGHALDETAAQRPDYLEPDRARCSLRKPFRPVDLLDAIAKCIGPTAGGAVGGR